MEIENSASKIEKFNGNNYVTWKMHIKGLFLSKGVWSIVNGTKKYDSGASLLEKESHLKKNDLALGLLIMSMSSAYIHLAANFDDVHEAWKSVTNYYDGKEKNNVIYMKKKLFSLMMKPGTTLSEHLNYTKQTVNPLKSLQVNMDDEDITICF